MPSTIQRCLGIGIRGDDYLIASNAKTKGAYICMQSHRD